MAQRRVRRHCGPGGFRQRGERQRQGRIRARGVAARVREERREAAVELGCGRENKHVSLEARQAEHAAQPRQCRVVGEVRLSRHGAAVAVRLEVAANAVQRARHVRAIRDEVGSEARDHPRRTSTSTTGGTRSGFTSGSMTIAEAVYTIDTL